MGTAHTWIPPIELAIPTAPVKQPAVGPLPIILPPDGNLLSDPCCAESEKTLSTAQTPSQLTAPRSTGRPRLLRGLLYIGILLWGGLILQDAVIFLLQQWQAHPLLGLIFTLLVLAISGMLVLLIGREWSRYRQLRSLTRLRQESAHLIECQTFGAALPMVHRIALLYRDRAEMAPCLEQFYQQTNDYLGDREILALFSTHLLSVVDQRAYQVVTRHASATALMTAVTPLAWLDALFFLWRSLWMIREIAELYGARPGATGSLVLLRQAMRGMMGAGLTDLLANGAAHAMGDSLAALMMARAGQGLSNGLFIARIGLQTMQACRPLPFVGEEMPGLTHIRKALQRELKNNSTAVAQKEDI